MFRSKRNALLKRLWRQRISDNEATRAVESCDEGEARMTVHCILKRLKEAQLEVLMQALESRGAERTGCVLVPQSEIRLGRRTSPHVLCCQIWRWPDVRHSDELKQLHCCESTQESMYICCNPYHWSRLYKPESPPPPYSRHPQELIKPEDCAPSEPVSLETGGTNQNRSYQSRLSGSRSASHQQRPWCNIAYWELCTRVGRLFPVHKLAVNVFADLPQGDGLCLRSLGQTHKTDNDSILKTREKIGLGVVLSQEEGAVWVYNRSDQPIFVNSPTLDLPNSRTLTVFKVLSGYSIKIFDYEKSKQWQSVQDSDFPDGPFDRNAVRISFAKGWGPKYSRQFITSCPCWLEVLLTANRRRIPPGDNVGVTSHR